MSADENAGATESGTPIAEQAGAAVEQQVAVVETGAQSAIAEAQKQQAAAQETAEQIASAALQSEQSRRISEIDERVNAWRLEQETTHQQLSALETNYGNLAASFGELKGLLAGLAAPQPSTPPNNPAQPQASAPTVEPSEQENEAGRRENQGEAETHQPPKRRRTFL